MELPNGDTLRGLCQTFALGEGHEPPVAVEGGLQHQMFRLKTKGGDWALKRLSGRALASSGALKHFARCEMTARTAAQAGLPAVAAHLAPTGALSQGGEEPIARTFYQGTDGTYLVYGWEEGEVLPPFSVGERRAALMGSLLGRLHALDVRYPDQHAPTPQALPPERWRELARRGRGSQLSWAEDVNAALPRLLAANTQAMYAGLALQAGWVNGHGDYDQKNVLWRDEETRDDPLILDWEQSGPWHPAQEVVGAALGWAGFSIGMTEWPTFAAFLRGYREVAPLYEDELLTASQGVVGKWLVWLEFNLARTLETDITPNERRIASDCAHHALAMSLTMLDDAPTRERWCQLD